MKQGYIWSATGRSIWDSLKMIRLIKDSLRVVIFTAVALVLMLFIVPETFPEAFAQSGGASSGSKNNSRRTSINFEDQLVEGQAQKPELFYLLQQRNNNFKRLIRLRENFLPEMRKASEDVGRPSSRGAAGNSIGKGSAGRGSAD